MWILVRMLNILKRTRETIWKKYNRFAFLYDLDDLLFLGKKHVLRKRVIELTKINEKKLVLDLMTGTADSSILAAKYGGKIIGVDFSKSMLKIGDRKISKAGLNTISLVQANGETLPFKENTFDSVICTFGIDTVYDPEMIIYEMIRVAKESALIGIAYKSFPKNSIVRIFDTLILIYLVLFWKCRNVSIKPLFLKAGLNNLKEEHYYFKMVGILIGKKLYKNTPEPMQIQQK
jgi:ubiquinone/menaquinone biosynthesis C-methylase UbiE